MAYSAEVVRRARARLAEMKADKLFISAVPSFETVAFYFSMGCQDTQELIEEYMDTEHDRYLEYSLTESI